MILLTKKKPQKVCLDEVSYSGCYVAWDILKRRSKYDANT